MKELSNSQRRLRNERKAQTRNRRDTILDAAWKLFLKRGIIGVTINDICMETELSRATLYRYFDSLEHIAYELAGKIYDTQLNRIFHETIELNVETARSIIYYLIDHFDQVKNELAYLAMFDHHYPLATTDRQYEESYLKRVASHFAIQAIESPLHIRLSVIVTMARGYLERLSRPGLRPERESYLDAPRQLEILKEIVDRELEAVIANEHN